MAVNANASSSHQRRKQQFGSRRVEFRDEPPGDQTGLQCIDSLEILVVVTHHVYIPLSIELNSSEVVGDFNKRGPDQACSVRIQLGHECTTISGAGALDRKS